MSTLMKEAGASLHVQSCNRLLAIAYDIKRKARVRWWRFGRPVTPWFARNEAKGMTYAGPIMRSFGRTDRHTDMNGVRQLRVVPAYAVVAPRPEQHRDGRQWRSPKNVQHEAQAWRAGQGQHGRGGARAKGGGRADPGGGRRRESARSRLRKVAELGGGDIGMATRSPMRGCGVSSGNMLNDPQATAPANA